MSNYDTGDSEDEDVYTDSDSDTGFPQMIQMLEALQETFKTDSSDSGSTSRSTSSITQDLKTRVFTEWEIDFLITHVVFPLQLQLRESFNHYTNSFDNQLSSDDSFVALLSMIANESDQAFQNLIPNTLSSIKIWEGYSPKVISNNDNISLESESHDAHEKMANSITSIQSGNFLPFFLEKYNVALIISKPNEISDSSVVISWLEISPNPEFINSHNKLHAIYPECSFEVPFSNLLKSKEFAEHLIKSYDGTSGIGFVEWLTIILVGSRNPSTCQYNSFESIQKSIRDEALASSGIKRSGLWTTLKLSLHLCLVEELGITVGTVVFKLLMIEMLYQITKNINTKQHDMVLIMEILVKLSRKIEKLNRQIDLIETNNEIDLQSEITSTKENILKKVNTLMDKTMHMLNSRWNSLTNGVQCQPEPNEQLKPKLSLCFENSKATSYNSYLFGENRIKGLIEYIDKIEKEIDRTLEKKMSKLSMSKSSTLQIKLNGIIEKQSFEKSVRNEQLFSWMPLEFRDKVFKYFEKEKESFKENPIASSKIILTILQSIRILDQITTKKYPLLKEHTLLDLDVTTIIQKLLLPTREETELAMDLQVYFTSRKSKYPSLISETEPSSNSFAVRFVEVDIQMKQFEANILNDIRSKVTEKMLEIQDEKINYAALEIEYRNASCSCQSRSSYCDLVKHCYDCPKASLQSQMNHLKVSKYVYPIPMHSSHAKNAIVFELHIPDEIAALRDIILLLWLVLSSKNTLTRYKENNHFYDKFLNRNLSGNVLSTTLTSGNSKFYLGKHKVKAGSISVKSHMNNFFVRNVEVKYVWNPKMLYALNSQSDLPNISFDIKLENNSPYSNMESFIHSSTHTQNQVISQQGNANLRLQLGEFVEFGTVRAGHRLHYRNIYRAIVAESLSFQTEEIFSLISQTIWQVGPFSLNTEGMNILESHFDLNNIDFMSHLLTSLDDLIIKTKDNWSGSFIMLIAITVTKRLLEFNLDLRVAAVATLRNCREIFWNWITMIRKFITEDPSRYDSVRLHLIETAVFGALTFDVGSTLIPEVLNTSIDALHWLKFQATLYDEYKLEESISINSLRKNLLRMVEDTSYNISVQLDSIIKNNLEVLDDFIKIYMGTNKISNLTWLQSVSDPYVYGSEFVLSTDNTKSKSTLFINMFSGEFLINGSPSSKLPREIMRDNNFIRVFGNTQFHVTFKDTNLGRVYTTTAPVKGCYYEFTDTCSGAWNSRIIIIEKRDAFIYKLIPLEQVMKEIPCHFVQGYSHWWNKKKNIVEFRSQLFKCDDFQNPKFILHLNSRDLVQPGTNKLLTYMPETDIILQLLHVIELPTFILIWKQDGEIITQLPRFSLTFLWNGKHLICQEYNGMRVIKNPQLNTLVGLQKFLILEDDVDKNILKSRKLIVPHGQIEIKRNDYDQSHASVDINISGKLKCPPFFVFEFNEGLKTLTAGNSSAAWLYLAALHGATSSPLVDPFTGLTGLEMAIYILQSGHCWSCRPYDEESLSILKFINELSPKRTFQETLEYKYGKREKVMLQKVGFKNGLSSYAAFDGYRLIIKKLYEDSRKTSFLFPSMASSTKHDDINDTSCDLSLTVRAYWRSIGNYNKAAWIKPEFLKEFSAPPVSVQFFPKNKFGMPNKIKDVHIMSKLSQEWKVCLNGSVNSSINKMIYNGCDFLEGLKPESSDDLAFLRSDTDIRDHWIQLYKKALKCDQEQWVFILCNLACKSKIKLNELETLHAIAVNREKFPQPPDVLHYKNITEVVFDIRTKIRGILESYKKHYNYYNHYSKMLQTGNTGAPQDMLSWENESSVEMSKLADNIEEKWMFWKKTTPLPRISQFRLIIDDVKSEKFMENYHRAVHDLQNMFESLENNEKLKSFIDEVEILLNTCVSNEEVSSDFQWPKIQIKTENRLKDIWEYKEKSIQNSILEHLEDYSDLYNEIHQSDEDFNDMSIEQIFDYFTSTSENYNTFIKECWEMLTNYLNSESENKYRHIVSAGLSQRIVPIIFFRETLQNNFPEEINTLIGTIGVLLTMKQRADRILRYTLDDSKKILMDRELKTYGHQNWIPSEYPEWLILELELDVMIRDVQVDVAKHMLDPSMDNSVTQLNMGEGKTFIIVPMLVTTLAKSMNYCTRVTVLKSLYETNYKGLVHTLGGILNQRVYIFPCARDWTLTKYQVTVVQTMYEEIVKEKGVNLTIPEYRLSWELRSYESSGKDTTICESLINLVDWMYNNVLDILDESDEILSVKYQKVYAIGLSEKINEVQWTTAQRLLRSILHKLSTLMKTYKSCIEMNSDFQHMNSNETFPRFRLLNYTDESDLCYQELINELAQEFVNTEFSSIEDSFLVLQYLTDPTFDQNCYKNLEIVCSVPSLLKKLEKTKVMAELLCHPGILQCALNKRWRVNYGVNPKGIRHVAVPFRAKDVAHEKTEFGHPGMAIVLTQLNYYYSGLNDQQLTQCFETLERAIENPGIEFDSWINSIDAIGRPNISYNCLNLKFHDHKIVIFNALRKNMNVIDFWLSHCVYPRDLRAYPNKITCTAWDLCYTKNRTVGFSGTNDMSMILPIWITQQDLEQLKETNEEVRTTVEKCHQYKFVESWIPTASDILQKLFENKIKILIDAGALMTDLTNVQVAQEWLKISKDKDFEAVVYFNDKNELTVRNRGNTDCPFELSPLSETLDRCAVYLDDEHTRGTDLRFPDWTVGCVTLGGRMTRDKLVQACMRLRLLQSGHHKLFFLASREAHNQIKSLIKDIQEKYTPKACDVMHWVCHNSSECQKDGLVFWANSGLNFAKKRAAVLNFQSSRRYDVFAEQVQDRDSRMESKYMIQENFVEMIHDSFDIAMNTLLQGSTTAAGEQIKNNFLKIKDHIVDICVQEIPNRKCFSNNLEEEQEREIEQEMELEIQKSRPRCATPYDHKLSFSIREFIMRGFFIPKFMDIIETKIKGLFASKDYLQVTQLGGLRPVNWIAIAKPLDMFVRKCGKQFFKQDRNKQPILLLLSPFEVNELIPYYRNSYGTGVYIQPHCSIRMFTPRLRGDQQILFNNLNLQWTGSYGGDIIEGEALAKLHMYAGSMYFDSETDEANCYKEVARKLQDDGDGDNFDLMSFIAKNIQQRHQHFPDKCDVYKLFNW